MNTSNSRPDEGRSGDSSAKPGDWRIQLAADLRPRVVNRLLDTLKRHLPYSGDEALQELTKIAGGFEKRFYTCATSRDDYLRKISLKILAIEIRVEVALPDVSTRLNSIVSCLTSPSPGMDHKLGVVVDGAQTINPYKRDPLCEIVGPMTRARTKRRKNALNVA